MKRKSKQQTLSRLRTYSLGTKNLRWFRPIPDLSNRGSYAAYYPPRAAFPLGFLLVPCCDGQQKKVLICGQHLSVCIGKRVSYFTSSYLIGADQQRVRVSWYRYGTKTGGFVRFSTEMTSQRTGDKDTKNTNTPDLGKRGNPPNSRTMRFGDSPHRPSHTQFRRLNFSSPATYI